jgi:DNA-binding winged helix-turn-helix (wHTH) protein
MLFRFADFELDSSKRLLLRNGVRIPLTPKALDVLMALVERNGETVHIDELLRLVWPDTTVEEISLTRNISVLRKILGERPDEHNFIVTVPGTGYRFVAPVERSDTPAAPARRFRPTRGMIAATVLIGLAAFAAWHSRSAATPPAVRAYPLTTYPGFERSPALSPEGERVAFTWDGEKQDNFDIYVKAIAAGAPLRLTTNAAADISPAWSPDGGTIAFLRRLGEGRNKVAMRFCWSPPLAVLSASWQKPEAMARFVSMSSRGLPMDTGSLSRTGNRRISPTVFS